MSVIPRAAWAPQHGTGHPAPRPQSRVVFHHAPERVVGADPTDEQIARQIRIMEDWHAKTLTPTNPRIGYQFIAVDQTAEIWEGIGWGRIGAHVGGHNTASLGILILGVDGARSAGRPETWNAIGRLIREGVAAGHLTSRPELAPHRKYRQTDCPGDMISRHVAGLKLETLIGPSPAVVEEPLTATVIPPNLKRIILPEPEHFIAAAEEDGFGREDILPGAKAVLKVLKGMEAAGVKQVKVVAEPLAVLVGMLE